MKHLIEKCSRKILSRCLRHVHPPPRPNVVKCGVYMIISLFFVLSAFAEYRFPIGEKAVYSVHWGLIPCGTTTISCDQVCVEGKELIRIRVWAKSSGLAAAVYAVDDTVDCYIDPETQQSVRLEKNTDEGGFICKDVLQLDRVLLRAQWDSESQSISTNYPIETATCDAVSFLYDFRQYTFTEGQSRDFKLAVDTALHGVTITAAKTDLKEIGETGKVLCRKFIATPQRKDLFVRKIPKEIWITEDARKIMVKMVVKVPVGKVRIVLDEYHPPPQTDPIK